MSSGWSMFLPNPYGYFIPYRYSSILQLSPLCYIGGDCGVVLKYDNKKGTKRFQYRGQPHTFSNTLTPSHSFLF